MQSGSLQQQLLEQILDRFHKKSEAVAALSRLLEVSEDAIYRRLRGDTLLSPWEIELFATTFGISIDNILYQKERHLLFSFNAFDQPVDDFSTYMDQLLAAARTVYQLPDVQVYYAVQELSIFLLAAFPRVFTFRMFVYGLTYWKFDRLQDRSFGFDLLSEEVLAKAREVMQIYNHIPSHEIWDLNLIDNTLNQIEYLATIGGFEDLNQVQSLFDELHTLIEHLRQMAKYGKKFAPQADPSTAGVDFDLYYNEFASTNDSLLVSSPAQKLLFTSFGSPDFLSTRNNGFCDHLETWFKTIIARSTSISTHTERKRDWFFRHLEKKLVTSWKKIKVQYDY